MIVFFSNRNPFIGILPLRSSRLKPIRLIVVEDNRLLREGLTAMLNEQPDITVVASLSNGDALERGRAPRADVVLLDLVLRLQNSLRLVKTIGAKKPKAKSELKPIPRPRLPGSIIVGPPRVAVRL